MFLKRANQYYNVLNDTDFHILKYIVNHLEQISAINIDELALKCNTSRASIYRFSKKLDFKGFAELKNFIKWDQETNAVTQELFFSDTLTSDYKMTVSHTKNNKQLRYLVDAIFSSEQVFLFGTGQAQYYCVQEMQRLFMQIGKYLNVIKAQNELELVTKTFNERSLLIIVSLSGDISVIEDSIVLAKMRQATLASITSLRTNRLSETSDYGLYAVTTSMRLDNSVEHNSFFTFFFVIEYIFLLYAELYYNNTV